MKLILYFLLILVCVSCTSDDQVVVPKSISDSLDSQTENTTEEHPNVVAENNTKINSTDSLGRKQGIWEKYYNNKITKREFYKDGKLDGKNYEYWANGEILESTYNNGIRQGFFMHYEPNASTAKFITFWQDNQKIWSTFPNMIETDFIPIKGFLNSTDKEIELVIPYVSGKTLARGTIDKNGVPIGKHRIYFETQELKAIVDYDVDSIKIFTKTGKLSENRELRGKELIITSNIYPSSRQKRSKKSDEVQISFIAFLFLDYSITTAFFDLLGVQRTDVLFSHFLLRYKVAILVTSF